MALLQVLHDLARLHELQLVGVAHFNHRLRSAADDDERFVMTAAAALGVRCVTDREDVAVACEARRSVDRGCRAHGAPRVSGARARDARAPISWPSGTLATIRPRRCSSGCCEVPGPAGCPACTRAAGSSCARCSTVGATS